MKSFGRSLAVVAIGVAAASCGGGGSASTVTGVSGGTPTSCTTGTFCMGPAQFVPNSATVAKNTTVVWVNNSGIIHNVTFDNPSTPVADINTIDGNATASRTFPVAGVYPFHCNIHAGMTGTLTVQ